MPAMKFISHQSASGPPSSGYKPRSNRNELAKHETFIRKLHTEYFTTDDIVRILANLSEHPCDTSRAQLFLQLQNWGLTRNETRKRRRNALSAPVVPRNVSLLSGIEATPSPHFVKYGLWDEYLFDVIYRLTIPEILQEDITRMLQLQTHMLEVARTRLDRGRGIEAPMLPTVILSFALVSHIWNDDRQGMMDSSMSFPGYERVSKHLDAYNIVKHWFTTDSIQPQGEVQRLWDFVFSQLNYRQAIHNDNLESPETEANSTKDPIPPMATCCAERESDSGVFLFTDILSRSSPDLPQDMIDSKFDSRPIRQRLHSQLAQFPAHMLMWMAGGLDKYSTRARSCILALLLRQAFANNNIQESHTQQKH